MKLKRLCCLCILVLSLILSACQKRPTITFGIGPSSIQDSTDELEVQDGKYQEALERCQEKLKQVPPDSVDEAEVLQTMGCIYAEYVRNKEQAVYYINKAIEIDQRKGDDIDLAEDYTAMSLVSIYAGGDTNGGLNYLDKADEIYKKYDSYSIRQAKVLMNKSRLYQREGKLDKALESLKEADAIYDKNQKDNYVLCLLTGGVYLEQKEYKLAEEQYLKAKNICESKKDHYGEAITQFQLGWLYDSMREYDKAIESYQKALEFYRSDTIYLANVAKTCNNLADCYSELYKVDESVELIIEANRLIRSIKPETSSTKEDEELYKHNLGMYYKGVTGDMTEEGFETWYTDVIIDGKDWKQSLADEGKEIIATSKDDENEP